MIIVVFFKVLKTFCNMFKTFHDNKNKNKMETSVGDGAHLK